MDNSYRPPIPDVQPTPSPQLPTAPRPAPLDALVATSVACTLLNSWLLGPSYVTPEVGADAGTYSGPAMTGAVVLLSMLVDFCLWRGRGWARVLTMIGCALSLLSVFFLSQYNNPWSKLYSVSSTLFYAYLLLWLARPEVAAYFKGPKARART